MTAWAYALGWALLHFLWQGLLVGGVTALLLHALRRASAASRYALCGAALLLCVALPVRHLCLTLAELQAPLTWQEGQAFAQLSPWLLRLQAALPWLVAAWGLGVLLMFTRLGLGLVWVARLRRWPEQLEAGWQARLDRLAQDMGLRGRVVLRVVKAELPSPLTVGWWRPVVIVPASLLTGLPPALLEALLAHELAHVRRADYVFNLLQGMVEALLFFHPVVWCLSRRMRAERELIADALAAQVLGEPRQLALALNELAHGLSQPQPALAASDGDLLARIKGLLRPEAQRPGWRLLAAALALAGTVLMVQARTQEPEAAPATPPSPAAALLPIGVSARHMLVLDDASGQVLAAKDAEAVVPVASISKLMTAMVVLDSGADMDEPLRVSPALVAQHRFSNAGLKAGTRLTRGGALTLTLLASDNRAAELLAQSYPGGLPAFERATVAKARALGLSHTDLRDASGASDANRSTAQEVARLLAAAERYEAIARITSGAAARVPLNGHPALLHNTNPLVGEPGWDIQLSKTGSSQAAGGCVAVKLMLAGKPHTVVLLAAADRQERLRDLQAIRQALSQTFSGG
ncbi:D-alanyl-D-alanine endopeptidase (penicillin-binding protein 7) [Paucibacter oligotrophus]|uniref:D-alanyl-D-alanine endopeptidase (Penicillin-binding protein 7) n=1 Tax=Roseateles oligotrophus TaxID=1769250 RepID=A0A840LD84_9BURK|nr:M56 family metallopeptidase [Roseateles oligotrophus]MBB4843287.1 D-alanyl-D-alanine endopeptidase (penicillin-binding protein 7) [Roseateles oligotrophus]